MAKTFLPISTMMRRDTQSITQSSIDATVAQMQEGDRVELASGE
jgi:hypothetical protein